MSYQHAVVWIDHLHATVIDFTVDDQHIAVVEREGGQRQVHRKSGLPGAGKPLTDLGDTDDPISSLTLDAPGVDEESVVPWPLLLQRRAAGRRLQTTQVSSPQAANTAIPPARLRVLDHSKGAVIPAVTAFRPICMKLWQLEAMPRRAGNRSRASRLTRCSLAQPTTCSHSASTTGRWNEDPALDRTTFGSHGSTQEPVSTTASPPNASAERIMLPRFPGSRTSYSTRNVDVP